MKRSTLRLLGSVIIAFVAGIAVGGYLIPSQGPMFGGYYMHSTPVGPIGGTTTQRTFRFSRASIIPSLTFPINTMPVGCNMVVIPVLAVFSQSAPAPVTYAINVEPKPPLRNEPLLLDAEDDEPINYFFSASATFSPPTTQPVMPPFTSIMTIPVSTFIGVNGPIVPPGVYQITIFAGMMVTIPPGGVGPITVCSENVYIQIIAK